MTPTRLLLAASLVLASAPATAAPVTGLVVVGDSLSDIGNFTLLSQALIGMPLPLPPYAPGRASNGPVAVEVLAEHLGLELRAAATPVIGGNNYAVIGAATGDVPIPGGGGATADNLAELLVPGLSVPGSSLLAQATLFASMLTDPIDPNTLFVVWGGPNDLYINPTPGIAMAAANNLGMVVDLLYGVGARHFLVPNMPDLGATPGAGVLAGLYSALTGTFNVQLGINLDALDTRPGIRIDRFDTFGTFAAVLNNPAAFGFVNVTAPCYVGGPLGLQPIGVCLDDEGHVFWDGSHPGARAHELLGNAFAETVVPEPATLVLAGLGVAALAIRRRHAA